MLTLRHVQALQDQGSAVKLDDGRIGKIVRVDTLFPQNTTEVSVYYTEGAHGPGIAKVGLNRLSDFRDAS
jgi:hypothetical protein